jgi:hypothetical protein
MENLKIVTLKKAVVKAERALASTVGLDSALAALEECENAYYVERDEAMKLKEKYESMDDFAAIGSTNAGDTFGPEY